MTQSGQTGRTFVGRPREMAELKAAMDDAMAGRGRLVMLAGEPGIGKTRTAQELSVYAESLGAQVWWGTCHEQQGAPPYWPWVQPIRAYIQQADPESLRAEIGLGAAEISEIIPEVRDKLPGLEPAPPLEPAQARFRLFDSISRFLLNLAQSKPLMLVLDDLQWADQPSILLLEYLAGQLTNSKIMLIGTYRDTEVSREHSLAKTLAQLARNDSYRRLELAGLETEFVGQLIFEISGAEPSQKMVQAIYGHTEGNPFFMTEIIRLLGERRLPGGEPFEDDGLSELEIPHGVLDVVGQRLNRLSAECESALTTAAVIGRQFDFRVLGLLDAEVSEIQMLESMDEGLEAHLIQEVPGQRDVYQFSHALVQQTLRERLSTSRRVRLHARIGETLETLYGEHLGDHAGELAYHFGEAGPVAGTGKLVKYALLAGERALEAHAHEEALVHFLRGLLAKDLDIEDTTPVRDAESAALLFGVARAMAGTSGRQKIAEAFASQNRAFDFYAATGDEANAVRVAEYPMMVPQGHRSAVGLVARALQLVPADSPEAGRLLARHVLVMGLEEGNYQAALEALDSALAIADRTGDAGLELRALAHSSRLNFWHLQWERAVENGLRVIELSREVTDLSSEVSARFWLGVALAGLGESTRAQQQAAPMLAAAERLRDRYWLSTSLWFNELMALYIGDWQAARIYNERGLLVSPSDARLLGTRTMLEHETGNFVEGHAYLESFLETLRSVVAGPRYDYSAAAQLIPVVAHITGSMDQIPFAETAAGQVLSSNSGTPLVSLFARQGLSMIAYIRGDAEAAREQYANLHPISHTFARLCNDRILGHLAQTMGNLDHAVAHYEDAITFCRQAGYKPELAWSCHDLAKILLESKTGDRVIAAELLEESKSICGELGMSPLMERLDALQESIGSKPTRAPEFPAGLTKRESEVIRLVAAGRTDREIGEELFISVKTVGNHVSNILNKTGSANRAEAASYATRHGLAPDEDSASI